MHARREWGGGEKREEPEAEREREKPKASEVAVKVGKGTSAASAAVPRLSLSVDDRVEIFWDGEGSYYAGTVVDVEGGRVEVLYDDGDEGSYDMEREVWRLEKNRGGEKRKEPVKEREKQGAKTAASTESSSDSLLDWRKNWGPVEPEDPALTKFLRESPLWVGADWSKR